MGEFMYPLKVPLVSVKDTLLITLPFDIVDSMIDGIQEEIVSYLDKKNYRQLIIDVSSLDVIDSYLVRMIIKTLQIASFLGIDGYVTGIQPYVAITLVEMGFDRLRLDNVKFIRSIDEVLS